MPEFKLPGPSPDVLHLELDVPFTDLDAYVEVADRWMRQVPGRVAADDLARVEQVGWRTTSWSRHQGSFGEPGTPWGSVVFRPADRHRSSSLYAYCEKTYERRLLARLPERPEAAELRISELEQFGQPGAGDFYEFGVHVEHDDQDVIRLVALHRPRHPERPPSDEVAGEWAALALELAAGLPVEPLYGAVANDVQHAQDDTAFESRFGVFPRFTSMRQGLLRGYSWVTVVRGEQAVRLGGVVALRASGAFVEVRELPNGAVYLRATEALSGYDEAAVERVWQVVRPLLPAGKPYAPSIGESVRRLVLRDAATG